MRLRSIRLSVIPAVVFVAGTVGWNELVATEPGVEEAVLYRPLLTHSSAGPSASGHVEIGVVEGTSQGVQRYSFTARRHSDGTVRGQFQVFNDVGTELETRAHGDVTCMRVLPDGRTALLGGVITNIEPALSENMGPGAFWTVYDGGEGRSAEDAGSLMAVGGPPPEFVESFCATGGGPTPLPSSRGNIQVLTR